MSQKRNTKRTVKIDFWIDYPDGLIPERDELINYVYDGKIPTGKHMERYIEKCINRICDIDLELATKYN